MLGSEFNDICFDNLKEYWAVIANKEPAIVIETTQAISISTGMDLPLFNPVFLKRDAASLPDLTQPKQHSFWYDSKRNNTLSNAYLDSLELILKPVPMMAVELNREFSTVLSPEVTIEMLDKSSDLSHYINPLQVSYNLNDQQTLRYRHCLENAGDKLLHFVARKKDQVIGFASLFLHGEIAGLYNLAVLPEFRKQGIGAALHAARLVQARSLGYQYATLQASPMATALDHSLGFETLSEIAVYQLK